MKRRVVPGNSPAIVLRIARHLQLVRHAVLLDQPVHLAVLLRSGDEQLGKAMEGRLSRPGAEGLANRGVAAVDQARAVEIGGGGFVGDKYDLDMLGQSIYHQVPPCIESAGWVELQKGEAYTLEHYIILHPAYLFSDTFLNYMYQLQPLEYLPPRYSIRHFIDKCLWTLRYTPDVYVDGGQWGLYYKNWYALNKGGRVEKVSSLDWGSSWDIWNAYFLLLCI